MQIPGRVVRKITHSKSPGIGQEWVLYHQDIAKVVFREPANIRKHFACDGIRELRFSKFPDLDMRLPKYSLFVEF